MNGNIVDRQEKVYEPNFSIPGIWYENNAAFQIRTSSHFSTFQLEIHDNLLLGY